MNINAGAVIRGRVSIQLVDPMSSKRSKTRLLVAIPGFDFLVLSKYRRYSGNIYQLNRF